MDTPKRNYNYQVLLGEWYESKLRDEYKLALFLKKKERRDLMINKIRKLFDIFLKEVPLSLPTKGLAYGGTIQLLAPDVPKSRLNLNQDGNGLVLSITVNANEVDDTQDLREGLNLVGSSITAPCVRNTFYIESDGPEKDDDAVCYGDYFRLRTSGNTEIPFYVMVDVPGLSGPVGKSGYPVPKLCAFKTGDARFKGIHTDPNMRFQTEGSPIPPFTKVAIVHAPVGKILCVENDLWDTSLFSEECQISVHSLTDMNKRITPRNTWMFIVGSIK